MKGRLELTFYVAVGAGMALGTSAFTMVSGLFEVVSGLWALAAVGLAGMFCIVIALSIAELASMYPSAPGVRTYFKAAFGDRTSLVLIYLYLIFVVVIAGVESYMFALVARAIFPTWEPMAVVVGLLAFVIATNLLGLELPRGMQMLTAFGCIAIIFAMGLAGLKAPPEGMAAPFQADGALSSLAVLPGATGLAVFLFMGFEWVTPLGLRPDSYERKIPRSMPVSILALMATYTMFVVGLSMHLPRETIVAHSVPQVPYFETVLGRPGIYLAAALSVTAIFSTFNAGLMGGSRLISTLSREGRLPRWCGRMALATGAPVGAILLLGSLAVASSIVVVHYRIELLAAVIGAAIICVVYACYMLSTLRLRRLDPQRSRPYRSPIWQGVQWAMVVVLPAMAAQTLFSQPGMGARPAMGVGLAVVLALALGEWSVRRSPALPARRPSRSATSGS